MRRLPTFPMNYKIFFIGFIIFFSRGCIENQTQITSERCTNKGRFLNFTDLHFTPYYDTTLVKKLTTADYSAWDSIFSSSTISGHGKYGDEVNYPLFSQTLAAMKQNIPNPDFIIIGGDFICHDFGEKFIQYTGDPNLNNLHDFIKRTMQFIALQITKTFPGTVIFPTLGNNDSYCGDYQVEANGEFLTMFADLWYPIILKHNQDSSFFQTFKSGGYYTVTNPKKNDHTIIVLNSIFLSGNYKSPKYESFCNCPLLSDYSHLANNELGWLDSTLSICKNNNEKVWIISHIPPGIDVFSTLHGKAKCDSNITTYWQNAWNEKFIGIINKYSTVVKSIMAGHTHMDEFKLVYNKLHPVSYVHVTPSITPVFNNNPAYQVVEYDCNFCDFIDYETFYLDLANNKDTLSWEEEYSFKSIYGCSPINPLSLDSLFQSFNVNTGQRGNYMKFCPVASTFETFIDSLNWNWYKCGVCSIQKKSYANCACN